MTALIRQRLPRWVPHCCSCLPCVDLVGPRKWQRTTAHPPEGTQHGRAGAGAFHPRAAWRRARSWTRLQHPGPLARVCCPPGSSCMRPCTPPWLSSCWDVARYTRASEDCRGRGLIVLDRRTHCTPGPWPNQSCIQDRLLSCTFRNHILWPQRLFLTLVKTSAGCHSLVWVSCASHPDHTTLITFTLLVYFCTRVWTNSNHVAPLALFLLCNTPPWFQAFLVDSSFTFRIVCLH